VIIRVLLVDDHAVVREGLRTFLSSRTGSRSSPRPVTARPACGGRAAEPDVVLMDLVMPRSTASGDARAAPSACRTRA
jgi:NarL family two-component system response regulator LiaR